MRRKGPVKGFPELNSWSSSSIPHPADPNTSPSEPSYWRFRALCHPHRLAAQRRAARRAADVASQTLNLAGQGQRGWWLWYRRRKLGWGVRRLDEVWRWSSCYEYIGVGQMLLFVFFFLQFNCKLRPCLPVVMSNQYNLQFALCVFFCGWKCLENHVLMTCDAEK